MKNLIFLIAVLFLVILNSCKDSSVTPVAVNTGSLLINSNPRGAGIYLQGNFTGKYTPDTLKDLAFDTYSIKLRFDQARDSIFNVTLKSGGLSNITIDLTNGIGLLIIDSDPRGCVQHYSKMIITEKGGSGSTSNPYYVKVKWLYNNVSGDKRFQ